MEIAGTHDPAWQAVREAFAANFRDHDELGANLCIYYRGEKVVDIAAGWTDESRQVPFLPDTMAVVFSVTKAMTAMAAHVLVDRGLIDLDAQVSTYWPEFAANGKDAATVRMLLNHSVGLPGFHTPLRDGGYLDWDYMVERLAVEPPFWEPGLRNGYHALNFGWLVGEVVRRVSGQSLGSFFRSAIAGPLAADVWIGLPEELESRVATIVPPRPDPDAEPMAVFRNLMENPTSPSALTFTNMGGYGIGLIDERTGGYLIDSRALHAAEIGGAGGIASARGIAKIFDALGRGNLISPDHVVRMGQSSMLATIDPILILPTHFALGFMKSMDNRRQPQGNLQSFVIGETAFGHVGAGGSFGLYDRTEDLAIGYVLNRMHAGILVDERGQGIIDAAYKSLSYDSNSSGVWTRHRQ